MNNINLSNLEPQGNSFYNLVEYALKTNNLEVISSNVVRQLKQIDHLNINSFKEFYLRPEYASNRSLNLWKTFLLHLNQQINLEFTKQKDSDFFNRKNIDPVKARLMVANNPRDGFSRDTVYDYM